MNNPMTPITAIQAEATEAILGEITDRRGLNGAWDSIDSDIQKEVASCFEDIVHRAITQTAEVVRKEERERIQSELESCQDESRVHVKNMWRYRKALEWIANSAKYAGIIDSGKRVAQKMGEHARQALEDRANLLTK